MAKKKSTNNSRHFQWTIHNARTPKGRWAASGKNDMSRKIGAAGAAPLDPIDRSNGTQPVETQMHSRMYTIH